MTYVRLGMGIVTIFTNLTKTVLYFYGGFTGDFILIIAT